jgi:pimeloyl-ACP methyl ester carboxylesterase
MRKYFYLCCTGIVTMLAFACRHSATTVDDRGVHIDYMDTGRGDTTLVFVHGWCLNKTYWSHQVDFFKGSYRVVTVDLPGFGESGKNRDDWSVAAFGDDIDSLMSQLNLKKVVLVGHSMAGDIVLQAALHATDRVIAIVGVDNFKNVRALTPQEKDDEGRMVTLLKQDFTQVAFQLFKEDLFYTTTPDSIRRRILTDVANTDSAVAIACMQQNHYDEVKNAVAWGKPLFLINSDYRPTDTTDFLEAHIPFQVFYVHDTGHFPMVEKPDDFNKGLSAVLHRISTGL